MTHDDAKAPADRQFAHPGVGLYTSRLCAFCHKPRSSGGGKLIGPVRRFQCALCVETRTTPSREGTTP